MVFSSTTFIILFLPLVLLLYYTVLIKNIKLKNMFLLLTSLIFYAWGEPLFVLIMICSIIANWYFGRVLNKSIPESGKKFCVAVSVIFNLSILFIFKYLTFTLDNISFLFGMQSFGIKIALPIGISFFTFQGMSYVIDVYRKKSDYLKSVFDVGLYISFFPQLIAGPIVRYETIALEIHNRVEKQEDFYDGFVRFITGLSKKVLLSNMFAIFADETFVNVSMLSCGMCWIGAISYTFQIFFDFSGYSDMAIGLGKMFGFHFPENFNYPYISTSISEFWRRWHISLGSWFRDYVYFPLGGSKVGKKRLIFNLFVVWMLTGIWHGANWTFFIWGFMYFVLICAEKLTNFDKIKKNLILKSFSYVYTMLFVIIGWVIFRADSLYVAIEFIKTMFGATSVNNYTDIYSISFNSIIIYLIII